MHNTLNQRANDLSDFSGARVPFLVLTSVELLSLQDRKQGCPHLGACWCPEESGGGMRKRWVPWGGGQNLPLPQVTLKREKAEMVSHYDEERQRTQALRACQKGGRRPTEMGQASAEARMKTVWSAEQGVTAEKRQ